MANARDGAGTAPGSGKLPSDSGLRYSSPLEGGARAASEGSSSVRGVRRLVAVFGAGIFVVGIVSLVGIAAGDFDAFDVGGFGGGFVDFSEGSTHADVVGGDVEAGGRVAGHELQHAVFFATK